MAQSGDFHDHFSHAAPSYAAFRPTYPRALAESLAALAPSRALAWDVGAGSGQLSTLLAESFERVIATDASREQLSHAVRHPRIEFRVERESQSSLADASADLVTVAQAAHWFDLESFYREVRRVAKPGGVLALIAYGNARLEPELEPTFVRFYAETLGPHWPPERRHILAGYADLAFPFDELAFPSLAIEAELDAAAFLGYVSTWSALPSLLRAGGAAELERFRRELSTAWGAPGRERRVVWPLSVRVGRVR